MKSRSFFDSAEEEEGASSCFSNFKSPSTFSKVLLSLEAAATKALEAYLPVEQCKVSLSNLRSQALYSHLPANPCKANGGLTAAWVA